MSAHQGGLEFWRKQLAAVSLPVLSSAAAREALLEPGACLQELTPLFDADLPLALDVLLLAAQHPRIRGEVQGLQHAFTVLGTGKVQALVSTRLQHTCNPGQVAHRLYLQALATSRFAAKLVGCWEEHHAGSHVEHLQWITLLLGLARWKLPLAAPDVALEIERRSSAGERRAVVEQSVLGCSIDALNAAHLRDSGFPDDARLLQSITLEGPVLAAAARHAWTGTIAPELPLRLARILHQRTATCMLAHLLAWSARDSWYSRHTRVLEAVVSAQSNTPLEQVLAATRRTAVQASRATEFAGLVFTPAQQLFWPPIPARSLHPQPLPARAQAAATTPGQTLPPTRSGSTAPEEVKPAGSHQPDADVVEAFMQNCLHGRYPDLRQFMLATGQTLEHGLGLGRCLLFLKATNAERLGCYFAHGFEDPAAARKLSAQTRGETLLAKLFTLTSGSLWVHPDQVKSARQKLDEELRPHVLASGLLLGTIHLKERAVGVIWADSGSPELALNEQHYAEFRHMIRHFGTEFSRLTNARRS